MIDVLISRFHLHFRLWNPKVWMLLSQLTVAFNSTRQVLESFVTWHRFIIALFKFNSARLIIAKVHGSTVATRRGLTFFLSFPYSDLVESNCSNGKFSVLEKSVLNRHSIHVEIVEKQRYLFRREKCFPTARVRHVKEQPCIGGESETDAWWQYVVLAMILSKKIDYLMILFFSWKLRPKQ